MARPRRGTGQREGVRAAAKGAAVLKLEPGRTAGSPATRLKLIRAAEHLFARHGFSAVSLRQLCAAAGQRNTNAVRYHFGSKERLFEAIFEYRQAELEPIRQRLFATVLPDDAPRGAQIGPLLRIVVLPPLLIPDADVRTDYVRLLADYLNRDRDGGARHPLDYAPQLMPTLVKAHDRLFTVCALPRDIFDLRIQMVVGLALQAVIQRSARITAGLPTPSEVIVIDEMMAIAEAAMRAPPTRQ